MLVEDNSSLENNNNDNSMMMMICPSSSEQNKELKQKLRRDVGDRTDDMTKNGLG